MKTNRLFALGFTFLVACGIIRCNIETASGPTPYAAFTGETQSSSTLEIGKGIKNFAVPGSLPIVNSKTGLVVTLSADTANKLAMQGRLKSYNIEDGSMTVDVRDVMGNGTYNTWKVVVGGGELYDSLRPYKQAYTNLGFGMFLHFNMSTFNRNNCNDCYSVSGEWGVGQGKAPAEEFRPSALDCGQWADVAKSAGCKYMVLTTKHHDGFCIWPSQYTEYCVKNATVKTDVCKAFVDSARSRGLKIGFYYSIRDYSNGYKLSFIKNQLTELLTNYGEVICLWFDGWGWGPGYQEVPYDSIRILIQSIQPHCLIVENNHEFNTTHSQMIEYEMPIDGPPKATNKLPAEGNEPIRLDKLWFWHPNKECQIMSAQSIVDQLIQNNSRNAAYLLDLTPDTLGLIPKCQVDRMKEVGALRGVAQ